MLHCTPVLIGVRASAFRSSTFSPLRTSRRGFGAIGVKVTLGKRLYHSSLVFPLKQSTTFHSPSSSSYYFRLPSIRNLSTNRNVTPSLNPTSSNSQFNANANDDAYPHNNANTDHHANQNNDGNSKGNASHVFEDNNHGSFDNTNAVLKGGQGEAPTSQIPSTNSTTSTSGAGATSKEGERPGRPFLPPDIGFSTGQSVSAQSTDKYLNAKLLSKKYGGDPFFDRFQKRADDAGIPKISVTRQQGQFLTVLLKGIKAERVLEVGTLAGISTAFISLGLLPHGQIDTLELSPIHAKIAQENFLDGDLYPFPKIHIGPALDTLKKMDQPLEGGYDLVFIDADKTRILEYFLEGLRLSRQGGIIVVDNAVRGGRIALDHNDMPEIDVSGLRKLYDWIERDDGQSVLASGIQTFGKYWDGFVIATKL